MSIKSEKPFSVNSFPQYPQTKLFFRIFCLWIFILLLWINSWLVLGYSYFYPQYPQYPHLFTLHFPFIGFGILTISFSDALCYTLSTAENRPCNLKEGSVTDGTFNDL